MFYHKQVHDHRKFFGLSSAALLASFGGNLRVFSCSNPSSIPFSSSTRLSFNSPFNHIFKNALVSMYEIYPIVLFFLLIVCSCCRFSPTLINTILFDTFSIQIILSHFLHIYISHAFSLFMSFFLKIHVSEPYDRILRTILLSVFPLGFLLLFFDCKSFSCLINSCFAIAILILIA